MTLVAVLAEQASPASPKHSLTLIIGTGLAALAVVMVVWPLVKHMITAAHEGGHAMLAAITGGKIKSVKLSTSGGGVTTFSGVGWLRKFFAALAGYLGPSLFGLLGAVLLFGGHTAAVLWISLVFLGLMLLQIGNVFGAVVVIATGGLLFLVIRYGSRDVQTLFAYTWTWFLLVGGFRHVLEFRRIRPRGGKDSDSDAAVLRKMTFLPAPLWVGFFWIATFAALLYGGGILLGMLKLGR